MRVRILRPLTSPYGGFEAGDHAEVPDKVGQGWVDAGLATLDKSVSGPSETKAEIPPNGNGKDLGGIEDTVLYQCGKCDSMHKYDSRTGRRHLKHKVSP